MSSWRRQSPPKPSRTWVSMPPSSGLRDHTTPKAKGQDYVTVVYDLGSGDLWVHEGRTTSVLGQFLDMPSTQSPMLGAKQETCAGHQVFHIENISVLHPAG